MTDNTAQHKIPDIDAVRQRTKKRRREILDKKISDNNYIVLSAINRMVDAIDLAADKGQTSAHISTGGFCRKVAEKFRDYKADFSCQDRDGCMYSCDCLTLSWSNEKKDGAVPDTT